MVAMNVGIWGSITNGGALWGIFDEPGMWGPIIYGGVLIGLFMTIMGPAMFFSIQRKRQAKKQAKLMLDSGRINPKTIDRTLKILGSKTRDLEAKNLFRKLCDMIEKA